MNENSVNGWMRFALGAAPTRARANDTSERESQAHVRIAGEGRSDGYQR